MAAARQDCERLQGIVDDILDLSRIQAGRIELHARAVDAGALVEQAVREAEAAARRGGRRALGWTAPPEAGRASQADPERIDVVLANLLGNAVRHTPAGRAGRGARSRRPDDGVRFEVQDTGEGIPAQYLERIFERFFQVPGIEARRGGARALHLPRGRARPRRGDGRDERGRQGEHLLVHAPGQPRDRTA